MTASSFEQLRQENEELRHRLADAEDTLRAFRSGEVDAVFVADGSEQVYTLETPEKPYRLLVEQVPNAAATLTVDGTIIYCNRRFEELLRCPLLVLRDKKISSFVSLEGQELLEALLRDGQGEVPLQRPDGSTVPRYLGVTKLQEGALGSCLMVTDLTEQRDYEELKHTQEALRESEQKFDAALGSLRDYVFIFDRDGRLVYANRALLELWGLTTGKAFGRTMDELESSQVEAELLRNVRHVFQTGQAVTSVTQHPIDIDVGRSFETVLTPVNGADGRVSLAVGVSRDITERLRVEAALKDADRRKDEFLATLAHELRNPLAPIRNSVEILKTKDLNSADLRWGWDVIDRQVQLMARLLEDLLDVSRISSNKLELRKERVELAKIVEAALETSHPVIQAGAHRMIVTVPPEPILLDADPVRLAQVFSNLLNNAAKYTDQGGQISLTAQRHGNNLTVSIRDTGIGIVPEMLPRVFEIFTQAQRALARSQGGLGIGLSLVKGLVELHGGTIDARSEGPDRGSEFTVHLPIAVGSETEVNRPDNEEEQQRLTNCRILIVDDNRDSADSLAMLLRLHGNDVTTAYDGEQAIEAAESFRPQLVLLDLGMPKLSGYDACRRIRQEPWGRAMFMIALTGWGQEEDRKRTEMAGFDRHMVKPVDATALMKWLPSLFAEQQGQTSGLSN